MGHAEMTCQACQHDNTAAARFCEACGAHLGGLCPSCGERTGPQARFCVSCGAALTEPPGGTFRSSIGGNSAAQLGERRQLTVVFSDLVGSTALSQELDAEDWREVVGQYQRAACGVVERWGGHVAKNLGDGLLIYFGWPDAREDDAERAMRAGLAIIEAMQPVNAKLIADGRAPLAVRIGMHTGPAVIADGGEVFGETANLAARVQSAADPDTVMVTGATQRLVPGIFVLEDRGSHALKGIREPVPLYRVVQPSGVRSRLAAAAGRLSPFVGRELELATLLEHWDHAVDGEGQSVLVSAEAGVGKSRLVYQFRARLAALPHTWLECGASPYTAGTPFHPLIALVAQGLAFTATDAAAERLEKIVRGLGDLATPEHVALLADFLGVPTPTPLPPSPDVRRRRTMELLVQWLLAISVVQPLVLLVEDLHWCDASSLELLGRVVAQSAGARLLFLATMRPELTPPWPARSNLATLQLGRLNKRQAREMVTTLFGEAVPAETLEAIVTRADGVPLYVEELTKAVAEPGAARDADAIPSTLAGSLMARLDRLSTAKEVAQRAAVLGREFGYPLLAAVAEMDEAGLRQGLARLVDADVVFQRGEPPEATYTFKHALVQEAAYEALLKRTRQQLHGRVVDVLCARFPERAAAEPEVLARHAELAGRPDEAITYYGRAGERAQSRSAHAEAIGQFRKALRLLATRPAGAERDARTAGVHLAVGASLTAIRGYAHPETAVAYEEAAAVAGGDAARLGVARTGLGICYFNRGETERGRALAAEVLSAAEARGDLEQALLGHVNVAIPEHNQGKFASSLAHCERAVEIYDTARHHELVRRIASDQGISAMNYVAQNLWFLGRPDAALARAREAVAFARRLDDPFSLAYALFGEAVIHWLRRDVEAQRERTTEVIALSDTQGFPFWLGLGRALHAAARVDAGDAAALPEILPALAIVGETGAKAAVPAMLKIPAEAQRAAGRLAEAKSTIANALSVAAETGQPYFDADLHRLDGDVLRASGGFAEEAASRYHRALAIAREQGARSFELRAATSLARLWREQEDRVAARDLLVPVYATFTEGFTTRDLVDAKALLDDVA